MQGGNAFINEIAWIVTASQAKSDTLVTSDTTWFDVH